MAGFMFLLPILGVFLLVADPQAKLTTAIGAFAVPALWAVFLWGLPWASARSQFSQQPAAQGPKTMNVDESGLHWRWQSGQSDVAWTNFIRFLESETVFVLYSSPVAFNILPKRAFTPEQATSFREVLQGKLGSASPARQKTINLRMLAFLAIVICSLALLVVVIKNAR